MAFPGPPALGRGAVVLPGTPAPGPLASAPRVVVDRAVLAEPGATVGELHARWLAREPVVVELACEPGDLRAPEVEAGEPWRLTPRFELARERLQFLVWANNYDCRAGTPRWWWADKAVRAGAAAAGGGPAEVLLDGEPAWCDGGPAEPIERAAVGGHGILHRERVETGRLALSRHAAPSAALAPDQLAAVTHRRGAARVIAPAGSGKTRVLTERLRHLIVDRGVDPGVVTAVAYNRRAADELVERTADLAPHVRTLNSLGLAICNGTGGFATPHGRPRRTVIEEGDVRRILARLLDVRRARNTDPYAPYLDALSAVRLGLTDPAEVEAAYGDVDGFAGLFDRYCRVLDDEGLADFDHQIYEAIRILLTDPAARARAQLLSRHLLVDEFQDLTPAHVLLLRLMAAPAYSVFGVGDDDQVIYGYASASTRYLIDFDRYFPGATPYALEVNYRCPPAVVRSATNLLSHNRERIPKSVVASPGRPDGDGSLHVGRLPAERLAVSAVDRLAAWLDGGAEPSSLAVLARVNSLLLPVQVLAAERGIPTTAPLDPAILARTGVRSALAYLRIGLDPGRIARDDVLDTIHRPPRRVARNVTEMLTRRQATSVQGIRRLAAGLDGRDVEKLERYAADLDAVADAVATGDVARVLHVVRVDVGLGQAMDALDDSRREADRSTHTDDLVALEAVASLHPDPATFAAWLTDVLGRPGDAAGVQLSTIHRVKGREWDRVVVFGAADDVMPHRLASDVEEERRVFHVALTRCRHEAVVLADAAAPSPFVDELATAATPGAPRPAARRARERAAPAPRARADRPSAPLDARGERIAEALRAWRREVAAADGVPAYVVLHDSHLEGIAAAAPATLRELRACPGIGPSRLERYGDEILAAVEEASGAGAPPGG